MRLCKLFPGSMKVFINRVFNSDFYGSFLWDLYGKKAEMVYNTWSVSIGKMSDLHRKSYRYWLELMSGMPHIS